MAILPLYYVVKLLNFNFWGQLTILVVKLTETLNLNLDYEFFKGSVLMEAQMKGLDKVY